MPCQTAKTFELTIFGDLEQEEAWLRTLEVNKLVVAKETCPETQRIHLQGQITFKRSYSYAAVKKLHSKAHWEMTMATQDANYCRKRDAEPIIDIDNRMKKGARTDIAIVKEVVKATCSMSEVVEIATSVQSVRMAELWLKYKEPKRPITPAPIVHWRWGRAGVGKTRMVWENHSVDEVYQPTTEKWWEGYDGHKVILFDEFDAGFCTFKRLLRLTDRYPLTVETKGGSRQFHGQVLYFTSSYPPHEIYSQEHFDANNRIDQLTRRITSIEEVK